MKKSIFAAAACVLLMTSCGSFRATTHTATSVNVPTAVTSTNVADLEVGKRVTFRYTTTKEDRTGGVNNCKAAAITALLKQSGNADVIVSPEYVIDADLNYVEVTGRPATYKNFRSAN